MGMKNIRQIKFCDKHDTAYETKYCSQCIEDDQDFGIDCARDQELERGA